MTVRKAQREVIDAIKLLGHAEQRTREALADERVARAEVRTKYDVFLAAAREDPWKERARRVDAVLEILKLAKLKNEPKKGKKT